MTKLSSVPEGSHLFFRCIFGFLISFFCFHFFVLFSLHIFVVHISIDSLGDSTLFFYYMNGFQLFLSFHQFRFFFVYVLDLMVCHVCLYMYSFVIFNECQNLKKAYIGPINCRR